MKTKFRKVLLTTASIMFSAACFGSLATYAANATGETPEYLFTMNQGASVRKNKDTAGIRFSYTVTGDQYTAFQDQTQYTNVEYGMLITQESEATVAELYAAGASVFEENSATYTFDVDAHKANAALKLLVNITGDTLVAEKDDEGQLTGDYLFNAALTNISEENYMKPYVGVGYIKATPAGGTETYYFAENVENTRTITYVAEKAQEANETDSDGVIADYVTDGYAKLGLSGAGTEQDPYVVEEADYEALKTATANGYIYGVDKCMSFADGVDYSDLAADFADRNYSFVWAAANTDSEIELFNAPSKTAAAYNYYQGGSNGKSEVNPTAKYYDEFAGRYGVVSLKSSDYYHNQVKHYVHKETGADTTEQPDDYSSDIYSTYVEYNDFTKEAGAGASIAAGWRYYFASASGYSRSNGDWDSEVWDYMSIWLYIEGAQGGSVTVSEQYGRSVATVPYNTWYELKYETYRSYFDDNNFNESNAKYRPLFIIPGTGDYAVTEAYDQANIFDMTNNTTVYIDDITFGINPLKSLSVAKVDSTKAQITATKSALVTENITYTVRTPSGTALTVEDDLTFATNFAGTYTVTASVQYNGETFTKTAEYTIEALDLIAANEIEGFYSADSVAAAYGAREKGADITTESTNMGKAYANNTAEWWETFNGRTGVISLQAPRTHASYGSLYYLKSTVRGTSFYKYTVSGQEFVWSNSEEKWDYISIWVYVVGDTNKKVYLGNQHQLNQKEVDCNTWVEFKLYREFLDGEGYASFDKVYNQFGHASSNAKPLFSVWDGDKTTTDDYTVYVDSISYGVGESIEISVSGTAQVGNELTIAPSVSGYEGQTIKWSYVVENVTSSGAVALTEKGGETETFTPAYAEDYLVTVRAELSDGTVLYGSKIITVAAATTTE